MKRNKIWFYLVNFLIIIIVSALTIYKIIDQNGRETLLYLRELSLLSVGILTTMFLVNYFLEGIIISIAIKQYEKDFNPSKGFVVQSVGGLFSAITPLKCGYLPSVAYTYTKYGVRAESIIKSMAKTSFAYQFVCFLISIVSTIVFSVDNKVVPLANVELSLLSISLVGLAYNTILMIGYFVLVLSPWLHNFVIKIMAFLLFKIKKIENKEQFIKEKEHKMELIRQQFKEFFKNIKEFIVLSLLYVVKIMFFSGLPYVAYLLLTKEGFSLTTWLFSIVLCNLISYITNIIPIPGASGAAEVAFVGVFQVLFNAGILTSVMLVWRMFSYFINIIVGFIIFIVILNYKKKKASDSTQ